MNSVQKGETARRREGAARKAGRGTRRDASQARPKDGGNNGTTTHVIEPAVDARFVRLNISRPTYSGDAGRQDL